MDIYDPALIKALLPKVPTIGKAALLHTLRLSSTSNQWDLRTEVTVNLIRAFIFDTPKTISRSQNISKKAPPIKGKIWISNTTMPAPPEDDLRQALFKAIEALAQPEDASSPYTKPELLPVEAEWTGYRAGATKNSPELRAPEEEKYKEMMKEATSPTTILYFHGGAYYLMDPATHRTVCSKLAKLTKGRCFNVRYRLAPQNPFPAALLDALVAYFTLLYPPPDSFHTAVDPKHIVISGDSAGGNLSAVLLQTILQFRRQGLKVMWYGQEREVPLPAGLATNSGWMDITHSSPSCDFNGKYDYLPPRSKFEEGVQYPPCPIWPTSPPRKTIYAEDGLLCHPLVSPLAATSWEGSCPMWIVTGEELLSDEDKYVATLAAKEGVPVVFEEFEAMPHCFAMVFDGMDNSKQCFKDWAGFISDCVDRPESIVTKGTKFKVRTLKETPIDVKNLSPYTYEEVKGRMRERMQLLSMSHPDTLAKL